MMNTPKYFLQNVEKYPNEPALSIKSNLGEWETDSWSELYSSVLSVSKSLFETTSELISGVFLTIFFTINLISKSV